MVAFRGASPDEPASTKISVQDDILADICIPECEVVHIELTSVVVTSRRGGADGTANFLCWDAPVEQIKYLVNLWAEPAYAGPRRSNVVHKQRVHL